ncbi:MAG: hypothetical protein A2Y17_07200 [Clostridiales bacterium GWF2_38_85]|nr:MAG: hypothetical protein A2Y17_07200 [Clostridiales bacterium GWF2_38_85]HBL84999.1 AMP-dependent synthetase [Clostridiales bacterium]
MQIVKGKQYFKIREFHDLKEMYQQSLLLYGKDKAFVFRKTPKDTPESRTYQEFYEETLMLGTALIACGLKNKRIAIIGENSYHWRLAHFATICGVGVSVPLDRLLKEDEILALLQEGEVDAVVYDGAFHETMIKAAEKFSDITTFICMNSFKIKENKFPFIIINNKTDIQGIKGNFTTIESLLPFGRQLLDAGDYSYRNAKINPEEMAYLLFTSGTTSKSKAVMLCHRNICADIKALVGVEHFDLHTRVLSVLPLHHTFENTCGFVAGFYFGFTVFDCDGLRHVQKNMEEYKINCLIGVPLLFESFYNRIMNEVKKQGKEATIKKAIIASNALRKTGIDLRKVLFKEITSKFGGEFKIGICGAAPIDPEIIRFFDAIGVRILQGYGLTETSPVIAGCNVKVFVPGSVGHPLTGVEIAIDTDQPGAENEILVRGDMVMLGYYKNEEATKEAIDKQGWFHTGDIGRIDPKDNCLYITGRLKSMIVLKSGKKIFPEEIENLLGKSEFIKESLVWGETDEDGEVAVWAKCIINKEALEAHGANIEDETWIKEKLDTAIHEVNKKLTSFKAIRYFTFGENDMIKTTTQKIKRTMEIDSIKSMLEKNKIKLREIAGKNMDAVKNFIVSYTHSDSTNKQ